ncbi:MAG: hypothetical protein HOI10_05865 [Deltaproteobacteria bacterium]|nr:hypothetical protein [Deltaproteobacteria bacterium]
MLVGEFTNSAINRVFLEKVNGQYQGACFPFMDGFPSAVLRLKFSPDGTLFVGMSNRGWSSLGNKSYGLQKVNFTGKVSLAIKEIRATPTGFDLELTKPVPNDINLKLSSFTYRYSKSYGGPEINKKSHKVEVVQNEAKPSTFSIHVDELRQYYVYEFEVEYPPAHVMKGYYTLNSLVK